MPSCYACFKSKYAIPLSISSKEHENLTGVLSSTVWDLGNSINCGPDGSSSGTEAYKTEPNWASAWKSLQNGMCAQRRLRSAWASAQSDQSSLCAQWVAKDQSFQWVAKDQSFCHADIEDSDQTGWMPRLIRVFAGRTCHFEGFVMRWFNIF